MSSRKQHNRQTAPANSVPLVDTIFQCFESEKPNKEIRQFRLNYRSSPAAKLVEIDPGARTFRFLFPDGSIVEGKPWSLLSDDQSLPSNALAAAFVFNATKGLWSAMCDCFNKMVSSGDFALFARPDNIENPFSSIPADTWAAYKVVDWEIGQAICLVGRALYGLRAKFRESAKSSAGRPSTYDPDQINGQVLRAIKAKGLPDRKGEPGWQTMADVERLVRDYCVKTVREEPVRSTLQVLAKNALAYAKTKIGVTD
jgi:hypothetical protein